MPRVVSTQQHNTSHYTHISEPTFLNIYAEPNVFFRTKVGETSPLLSRWWMWFRRDGWSEHVEPGLFVVWGWCWQPPSNHIVGGMYRFPVSRSKSCQSFWTCLIFDILGLLLQWKKSAQAAGCHPRRQLPLQWDSLRCVHQNSSHDLSGYDWKLKKSVQMNENNRHVWGFFFPSLCRFHVSLQVCPLKPHNKCPWKANYLA